MQIITNNHYRNLLYWEELTGKEKKDFTYDGVEESSFVRYRGRVYDLGEAMRCSTNSELKDWDGYWSDTFFSSVLVKYSEDYETVKLGMALA